LISRRNFLKFGLAASTGLGLSAAVSPSKRLFAAEDRNLRWVFLVDTYKCVGCGLCVRACKLENEVPYEAHATRTWVERYVLKKDGSFLGDSPMGARDGFTKNNPEGISVPESEIAKAFFVPKLCNQCEKPPCVQVCPVGATYRAPDGVVLVDRTWCIGCGYCIMACPYGARFFHPVYHTAEKCTFCYHRIHKGMAPACVMACPFGARRIGNIKNPDDPVTKIIKVERVNVLRPQLGSDPQAYYLGMDEIVR
jgi:tetrathionate reductase subunit B